MSATRNWFGAFATNLRSTRSAGRSVSAPSLKQDRIDRGEISGTTTSESPELRAARKRIRELETELAIVRQAAKFLGEDKPHPKGFTR